jgi:hypothetical protein
MYAYAKKYALFGLLSLATLLMLSIFTSLFLSKEVKASVADTPYLSEVYNEDVYKILTTHQHAWWLYSCFINTDIDEVPESEVDSWDFFEGSGQKSMLGAMYTPSSDSYNRDCKDQTMVKRAFTYLGYDESQSRKVFCTIPGSEYDGRSDFQDCIAGAGGGHWDNKESTDKVADWFNKEVMSKKPELTPPAIYMRAFASLVEGCDVRFTDAKTYERPEDVPGADDGSNGTKYAVPIITKSGDTYKVEYVLGVGVRGDLGIPIVALDGKGSGSQGRIKFQDCNSLVNQARDNVAAYAAYVQRYGSTKSDENVTSDGGTIEEGTTCAVDGIGWIICPVVTFLGKITDEMYDILDNNLLEVPAGEIFDTKGYAYEAWSTMRNIANVAFVISFLFIIYSQITGAGLSNYGIKKMLPKIIVAAILVNTSFWICAIAVDVSNIAGFSVKSMFDSAVAGDSSFTIEGVGTLETGSWWTQLGVGILAGASLVYVGLSVLLPALVVVAFAVITVVAVLAARQAIVILLIIVSPLAFVAYLLPNTEEWFKKWMSLLKTMLLVFPIISAVFGASALASIIIMGVAQEQSSIIIGVVGALISVVPLFITPILMKSAGGVLNRIGGFINNPNKGPFDRARKAAEGYRDKRQNINKTDRLNGTSMFGRRADKWKNSDKRFTRGAGVLLGGASRPGEIVAGGLAGRALTKERQAASAKASADFAEQNYVAERAKDASSGYAQKVAGPTGSASLTQAYAIEAIAKEKAKDRAAEKTIFEHDGTGFKDLGIAIKSNAYTGAREEAALQRYFETANSDGVQDMLEHINTMRSNTNLTGDALDRAKELTQLTGESLANSPLKPKNLSASNLTNLRNGEAIQNEAARIANTVAEGKMNASGVGQMDIDEIRRWTSNMASDGALLAAAEPSKIEAMKQAIVDAEKDPRINVKFGDREKEGLAQLKAQLDSQLTVANSTVGQKARQDAAASTYGPGI